VHLTVLVLFQTDVAFELRTLKILKKYTLLQDVNIVYFLYNAFGIA